VPLAHHFRLGTTINRKSLTKEVIAYEVKLCSYSQVLNPCDYCNSVNNVQKRPSSNTKSSLTIIKELRKGCENIPAPYFLSITYLKIF
jgi:hypothetical protein